MQVTGLGARICLEARKRFVAEAANLCGQEGVPGHQVRSYARMSKYVRHANTSDGSLEGRELEYMCLAARERERQAAAQRV